MLIEMFSDESVMEASMRQMGPGFERVLIDRRNQVVTEDLIAIIEDDPDVESVAIFYGAAHMPDLAERLHEIGYRHDPEGEQWFTAFEVDLDESVISAQQLNSFRRMLRQQMRMMGR